MSSDIKYVQLEPSAFLADPEFQLMTAEERGAYCTIIFYLYSSGGKVKLNLETLRRLCKVTPEFDFQLVLSKFQIKYRTIQHRRVTRELEKAQSKHTAAVKAVNTRWEKSYGRITSEVQPHPDAQYQTNPIPIEGKINKNNTNTKDKLTTLKAPAEKPQACKIGVGDGIGVGVDKTLLPLELGLVIAKARGEFAQELQKRFIINEKEAKTFAEIMKFLSDKCQQGLMPVTIFSNLCQWAREAASSTVENKKGLLVQKIKEETGWKPKGLLLKRR